MDGGADAGIGRAATEIGQLAVDVRVGRIGVPAQEPRRRHDHAGLAIAALRNVERGPSLLNGVIAAPRQPLDGRDLPALRHHHRHDAGSRRGAVDMHGAGTAEADAAAELASGQAEMLANDPQQWGILRSVELGRHSIDGEFHGHGRVPWCAITLSGAGSAYLYLSCAEPLVPEAATANASSGNGIPSSRRLVACSKACARAGAIGASTTS